MAKIAFIVLTAALDRNHFDGRHVQLCAGTKALLSFAEAFCFAVILVVSEKHIGHPVILVGVKKIISRSDLSFSRQRFSGARFGSLRQIEPAFFPALFISGFDISTGPGDVEQIAAALLRLRHQSRGLAAKRFCGK